MFYKGHRPTQALRAQVLIHIPLHDREERLLGLIMEFIAAYQNGEIKIYHGGTKSIEYTVPANVDSIVITINLINVHEITKNYEATEYEEYFPKRTEVKQEALPVASETAFGVCKIWTTVNEAGENVLNIVTGE